eukprot:GGOE01041252.1.p1 GENE.GGOE01041252.1~~GGOE01041252.1.p1  ORF type:complete len:348 (+),score=90.63 GGOE01041252.1:27-1070(+)
MPLPGAPPRPGRGGGRGWLWQLLLGLLLGSLIHRVVLGPPSHVRVVNVPSPRPQRLQRASHGILYTLGLHSPIIEVYRQRYNGRGPYLAELLASVETVKRNSPSTPIALVTDHPDNVNATVAALFDRIVIQSGHVHVSWGDIIPAVLASPWRRTLFLDLDVKVCGDVEPMFQWLDHYDLAVVPEPFLFSHAKGALLHRSPQRITWNSLNNWNTGVVLYDANPRVHAFFHAWNAAYNYPGGPGGGDQETFARLLEASDVRVKTLPAEFNLRVHTNTLPHFLVSPVVLLHSRYETCERVNNVTTPRLYDHLKESAVFFWTVAEGVTGPRLTSHCIADTFRVAHAPAVQQ